MSAKKLFISYSHADAAQLATLKTHLKPLERSSVIEPWFDGYLLPGDDIDSNVRTALEQAELIALLVSPDFMASDYCYDVEMQTAVSRHDQGSARVVPIILRESQWHSAPFGRLVAVPTDGKPIMSAHWPDKDHAWTLVAKGIEAAARGAAKSTPSRTSPPTPTVASGIEPMSVMAHKKFTDRDRDDFRHSAFDHIAVRFETSLSALNGDLSGAFRRIDANRFTGTIYRSGTKAAGCTLWVGGGAFGGNSVCYVGNDSGETNSMNEFLSVEPMDGSLGLKPSMGRMRQDDVLDVGAAAQYLWDMFVERLKFS